MKFLITGGAGFIGSHLTDALIKEGHEITVLDNLTTGRYDNIAKHEREKEFCFIHGSILDEPLVDRLVKECDAIFHLAAAVGVRLIVDKPLESLITNIRGTETVLAAANRYHKKILITSTSEIYGKSKDLPLREDGDRVLGPPQKLRWSYSTAKALDEALATIYWQTSKLPTITVRLFNTVGPRQTGAYGMVIPRFVEQALRGDNITIYGNGKQSRCFTHVDDVVGALIKLMHCDQAVGEVFNIGSNEEVTIEALAARIVSLAQSSSQLSYIPFDKAYNKTFEDMERRVPDVTKLMRLIDFRATYDLDAIIQSIIKYYREK